CVLGVFFDPRVRSQHRALSLRGMPAPSIPNLGEARVELVSAAHERQDRMDDLALAVAIDAALQAPHGDTSVEVVRALAVAIHAIFHAPGRWEPRALGGFAATARRDGDEEPRTRGGDAAHPHDGRLPWCATARSDEREGLAFTPDPCAHAGEVSHLSRRSVKALRSMRVSKTSRSEAVFVDRRDLPALSPRR